MNHQVTIFLVEIVPFCPYPSVPISLLSEFFTNIDVYCLHLLHLNNYQLGACHIRAGGTITLQKFVTVKSAAIEFQSSLNFFRRHLLIKKIYVFVINFKFSYICKYHLVLWFKCSILFHSQSGLLVLRTIQYLSSLAFPRIFKPCILAYKFIFQRFEHLIFSQLTIP